MIDIYNYISYRTSEMITKKYSTSFSLGIRLLGKNIQAPIYAIYGFVRLADEIVDTFHDYPKRELLDRFREDTIKAIDEKISLNPVLNAFQQVVHQYGIEWELIELFFNSMYMDLEDQEYDSDLYEQYILGSAEVVGLMCLHVFVEGNDAQYQKLKPAAKRLGAVFQKVNFLRDMQFDYKILNRTYFPNLDLDNMSQEDLQLIFDDITADFDVAFKGIMQLPASSKFGVYLAYRYYRKLFVRIQQSSKERLLSERIRIPNPIKYSILLRSYIRYRLNWY